MKVSEWLEQQGLTIDSEIPDFIMASTLKVPEELLEGLSEEDRSKVRTLARDSGEMEHVKTYVRWLKAGDIAMFNTGVTEIEALERIINELGSIRFYEKLIPFKPFEYFFFRHTMVSYAVVMRFTKEE